MDDIVKICKKHGELNISEIFLSKNNNKGKMYIIKRCRKCHRDNAKDYRKNNKEKIKEKNKTYRKKYKHVFDAWVKNNIEKVKKYKKNYKIKHKEKVLKQAKNYYCNNREKIIEKQCKRAKKLIDDADNKYIKYLLFKKNEGLNIPIQLIEAKRNYILLLRKLKELKNGDKKC